MIYSTRERAEHWAAILNTRPGHWDYAMRTAGEDQGDEGTMREFRETRAIILSHRS